MNVIRHLPAKRRQRHLQLALIASGCVLLLYALFGLSDEGWADHAEGPKAAMFEWRMSMALAYTAILFLGVTLAIGPVNALRRRPLAVNSYLRRDIGIWTGLLALTHVAFGASIHIDNFQFWTLWLKETSAADGGWVLQGGWFGVANFAGLLQTILIVLILVISNDIVMLHLGMTRWKNLQRLSYLALGLIFLHGFAYQRVENRDTLLRVVFPTLIGCIAMIQVAGFITIMRKRRATVSTQSMQGTSTWN